MNIRELNVSSAFPSKQSFGAHARPLCEATCVVVSLKFHLCRSCEQTAEILTRLRGYVGLPEPLLFAFAFDGIPVGTKRGNNVDSTFNQRQDVEINGESTLFNVVYLLEYVL